MQTHFPTCLRANIDGKMYIWPVSCINLLAAVVLQLSDVQRHSWLPLLACAAYIM